jgi:hypothetical protein
MRQRSEVAIRAGILLRGIASRRASAVVLFVAAAVAVAAAAIGPIFLGSGDLSILSDAFASAPVGRPDVVVLASGGSKEFTRLAHAVGEGVRQAHGLLEPPTLTVDAGAAFVGGKAQRYGVDVLARSAVCSHLRFTSGRCPTKPGQVAISERSAKLAGVGVGSRLEVGPTGRPGTVGVTVAGVYLQPPTVENRYWAGTNYFAFGTGTPAAPQLDPLVGTFATALDYARVAPAQLSADLPWSPNAPHAGVAALEDTVATEKARIAADPSLRMATGVDTILVQASDSAHLMRSIVLAIVLQLVLLVLLVLYALARATAAGRRSEAEFGRRHGFTRPTMFALAVGEPASLIVIALPSGLLVAWLFVDLLSRSLFAAGTPVTLDVWSVVAAVGVCCLGVLAVALASVGLWRRDDSARSGLAAAAEVALDVSAIVLALAGLLALATRGSLDTSHTDALALLAPGLLALGAGVIALRLVFGLVALGIRRTAESPRIASFLALRELGRRPRVLRQALPLAAAVTVCLFAVGSYARAGSNRSLLAHFEVGAARAVDVSVKPGVDLEDAVRRADPSGRQAMAAVFYRSSYGELLAVDSTRLATVPTWPSGLSAEDKGVLARRLSPPEPAPVVLRGDTARFRISLPVGTPPLSLLVDLYEQVGGGSTSLELGALVPGTHVYAASLGGECAGGCRVLDLSPIWKNARVRFRSVRLELLGISERASGRSWRAVPVGGVAAWRSATRGVRIERSSAGSGVLFALPGSVISAGGVLFVPASNEVRVPAVVTTGLEQNNPPTPPGNSISLDNLDGNPLNASAIAAVPTLPLVGTNGALVDLRLAQQELTGPVIDSTDQVWLADGVGPAVLRRLRSMGVAIGSARRASTLRHRFDRSGPALGYDLMLIVSPIAALLALGTIMFGIVSDGRRRRGDLRALRVSGIRARVARRSLFLENLAVMATALVVGLGIGLAALALALPSLPEFVSESDLLPVPTGVPFLPVAETAALLGAVFIATAASTTWLVLTRRPSQEAT